jgi:HPt (histidine-containing phosphotransfer) domain-containing protein
MTDALAPLRQRFRARAAGDLVRLRILSAEDPTGELRTLVHNLAGAAGIFGYGPLGEAATAVDDCYFAGRTPDARLLAVLEQKLAEAAENS